MNPSRTRIYLRKPFKKSNDPQGTKPFNDPDDSNSTSMEMDHENGEDEVEKEEDNPEWDPDVAEAVLDGNLQQYKPTSENKKNLK